MNTNTYIQKLDLIHWITELKDPSILAQVREIKDNLAKTSEAELASIARGLNDFKQGKVRSHSQVRKRYEKWL
jgi:predicted transcriptional regulator